MSIGKERNGERILPYFKSPEPLPPTPNPEAILMTWSKSIIFTKKLLGNEEFLRFRIRRTWKFFATIHSFQKPRKGR